VISRPALAANTLTVSPQEFPRCSSVSTRIKSSRNHAISSACKKTPVSEIEALMIGNAEISDDLIVLGNRREQNVRDWLLEQAR